MTFVNTCCYIIVYNDPANCMNREYSQLYLQHNSSVPHHRQIKSEVKTKIRIICFLSLISVILKKALKLVGNVKFVFLRRMISHLEQFISYTKVENTKYHGDACIISSRFFDIVGINMYIAFIKQWCIHILITLALQKNQIVIVHCTNSAEKGYKLYIKCIKNIFEHFSFNP